MTDSSRPPGVNRYDGLCIHGPGSPDRCGHPDCVGARWTRPTTPGFVRGWVVLDHRRCHVYSVTTDEAKALADLNAVAAKYDGDPLSVSRTVFVLDLPESGEGATDE